MSIDFEGLIELQRLDLEIQEAVKILEAIPKLIATIDEKITATDQVVAAAKEKLNQNQKKRRDLESEIKDHKIVIGKYKRQLNEVKTNKEYAALLKEIEETQKKIEDLEEAVIAELINADDIEGEIKSALQKKAHEEDSLNREKKNLLDKAKELEVKKSGLTAEKQAILPKIDPSLLGLYNMIYKKRNGLVLSPVKGEFCSLCHMRIRPQMINEIRERNELILCENCGRILYWPEEKETPGASPEQAKSG